MIENILIYQWEAGKEAALREGLVSMGYHCVELREDFEDCHVDAGFAMKVMNCMQKENIHMVLSLNYVPLLANVCEMRKVPYVAWICDCPLQMLFSKTVLYQCNYFFCFDRAYANRLAGLGCENVYHFPLAVDVQGMEEKLSEGQKNAEKQAADIFVAGSDGESRKWLEAEGIPEYSKGYLQGIEEAQIRVYGYNFVREMVEEETARDILEKAGIVPGEMYFDSPVQMVADFVNEEITEKERARVIERLSQNHELHLCTKEDMPAVFGCGKINLYITPKGVESGIAQPVLDTLACGGFCLTNYQPETAEFFEDGKELVMYTDVADLAQKADYYLTHDKEREAIAKAGREKVREYFSLQERLADMLHIVEEDVV